MLAERGGDTMRVTELTPGTGGTVLAVVHMPGRDERTAYPTGDWPYQVITVREGRIAGRQREPRHYPLVHAERVVLELT